MNFLSSFSSFVAATNSAQKNEMGVFSWFCFALVAFGSISPQKIVVRLPETSRGHIEGAISFEQFSARNFHKRSVSSIFMK